MTLRKDYPVQLDVFEGPLDLLLYLIKKDEIDICDIPIERVTEQYMEYLNLMRMLDLNIAGEFLVMSATLLMIKSRMLLPVEERLEMEEEEDDPRWELVRQLLEYKKFKDAAGHLEYLENIQHNVFAREGEGVALGKDPGLVLKDVGLFDLITAFNEALEKAKEEDIKEIFTEAYSIQGQLSWMLDLMNQSSELALTSLFREMKSRSQIVCTFLATLELIRLNKLRAVQEKGHFGDIHLICTDAEQGNL